MNFNASAVFCLSVGLCNGFPCLLVGGLSWCSPLRGIVLCYSLGGYSRFAHCSKLSCGARYVIMVSLKTRGGPKAGRVLGCMACTPIVLVQLMRCIGLHQYTVGGRGVVSEF